MKLFFENFWHSPYVHQLDKATKNFLFQTAKDGLAGTVIGYCVCQLSGANPLTYGLAYHSARISKYTDAFICKGMLAHGTPSATKKAIAFKASLVTGFFFFYQALTILGCQATRDEIVTRIMQNGFAHQTTALIGFCSAVLIASDHISHPLMQRVREAAIEAMRLRAKEVSWKDTAQAAPLEIKEIVASIV